MKFELWQTQGVFTLTLGDDSGGYRIGGIKLSPDQSRLIAEWKPTKRDRKAIVRMLAEDAP